MRCYYCQREMDPDESCERDDDDNPVCEDCDCYDWDDQEEEDFDPSGDE